MYIWKYLENRHQQYRESAKDLYSHTTGHTVGLGDFDIVKKVGTGAHGMVVVGYHKNSENKANRKMYAIKQMKKA
jgi:hypothetical protein